MNNAEFLTQIWDLEYTDRPGLILEESINYEPLPTPQSGLPYLEEVCQNALRFYNSLLIRDDNVPAIDAYRGSYIAATVFGARERVFEDGHRYLEGPIIFNASDVDKIKKPSALSALMGEQIEMIKRCVDQTHGECWIRCGDIQNPLGVAAMLWDTSTFYPALVEESQRVHKLLEIITEVTVEYITLMKAVCPKLVPLDWPKVWIPAGRGIYLADDTMTMVSPELYEEYGVTYNNRIGGEFGGILLHTCSLKERYFNSILKNEGLHSINFAAQYSSDMQKIFEFFGGKAVILPHYVHTDHPQIGTLPEFIDLVLDCWTPERPAIIYVSAKPDGGYQPEVFEVFNRRGFSIKHPS
jgi:hypothetical protein